MVRLKQIEFILIKKGGLNLIKVEVTEGAIEVKSPFCEEFIDFAHMRGGTWSDSKKKWMFDKRDEFAVRTALNDIYGTDDYDNCDKTEVRINAHGFYHRAKEKLYFAGREVARNKWGNVKLADNVVLIEGELDITGRGKVTPRRGAILEIRAVPRRAAEKAYRENPEIVEITGEYDIQQLKDEKEQLLKRISEIDETIEMLEQKPKQEGGIIADLQD